MKHSKHFKYRYDEASGIFVRDSEISVNWMLSCALGSEEELQITKVSNEQILKFLNLLDTSDLRMPDGKHSLIWLSDKLKERFAMASAKDTHAWEVITERYRYILEQIDLVLIKSGNYEERKKIIEQNKIGEHLTPNNMKASFEPL